MPLDAGAIVTADDLAALTTPVGLLLRQSSGQSFATGTESILSWDTADEQANFPFVTGTDIVVPVTGNWSIGATVRWSTNATGYRRLNIYVDGTLYADQHVPALTGVQTSQSVSKTLRLVAGQVITIRGQQTSGGSLALQTTSRTPNVTVWKVA